MHRSRQHQSLDRVVRGLPRRLRLLLNGLPVVPRPLRCPACGHRTRRFEPSGTDGRANARCIRCGSLERHRAFWLYLREHMPSVGPSSRVLVVAPDAFLEREGPRQGWDYLSVDLEPGLAMRRMDLTALDLPDEDRDLVIAYHVLEHIADDRAAMREIARVLRPGGTALIEVPLAGDETDERFIDGPVEQRIQHYRQADHVRMYGRRDFERRLRDSGLEAEPVRVGDVLSEHVHDAALERDEVFYVCHRRDIHRRAMPPHGSSRNTPT